jgi:ABC-type phosphate/phosphonate transport system substrate-binding protein
MSYCGELLAWGQSTSGQVTADLSFRGSKLASLTAGYGSALIIKPSSPTSSTSQPTGSPSRSSSSSSSSAYTFPQQNTKAHDIDPQTAGDVLSQMVDVQFGGAHALGLDAGGELYSWGSSKWGQLGLGAKVRVLCCYVYGRKGGG